jgi:phage protein U
MSGQAIARAMLIGSDGSILNCQFNPESLQRTKSARWQNQPARGSSRQPRHQFVGTGSESLVAKLLFDGFDSLGAPGRPVEQAVNLLLEWTTVPASAQNQSTPQPPTVTFQWGTGVSFKGYIQTVEVQYTMFSPDGRPLRATANVTMQALPDDPLGTNPTSGGVSGRTSAQVGDGDTLPSISYQQYGDPNLWRAIALVNGIDDPGRLRPGARLLVPPRSEAVSLAAVGDSGA